MKKKKIASVDLAVLGLDLLQNPYLSSKNKLLSGLKLSNDVFPEESSSPVLSAKDLALVVYFIQVRHTLGKRNKFHAHSVKGPFVPLPGPAKSQTWFWYHLRMFVNQ